VVALRDATSAAERAKLAAISNPRSASFGHYLTPRQYASLVGPSRSRVRRALALLRRHGLRGTWRPGADWMDVDGPAGAIDRMFHVRIDRFRSRSGVRFYASRHDPSVPRSLRAVMSVAGHISSYSTVRRASIRPGGLLPADLLTAYDIKPLRSHGMNGSGQTIAFIEIDGYDQNDLDAFTQRFNLPPLQPQTMNGVRLSDVEGETELDLEVAHEIAPRARLRLYNCPNNCSGSDLVDLETRAVRDNPKGIVSVSIGACEPAAGRGDAQAESAAFSPTGALGVSTFVASGDNGAYTCLDQDWGAPPGPRSLGVSIPASVPGVTAVGGTRLSLNSNSTWYREEVWENPAETTGSGGGRSVYFSRPSWQRGPGTGGSMRQVPDISAAADPLTSAQVVIGGSVTEAGGTSQAAPIWAGITALMNQYLTRQGKPVAGFLNPALYRLATAHPQYSPFHDVTLGTNLAYPAGSGYDMATGLGTPDAWNLVRDLAAQGGR
jgi:kumamolisin